MSRPIKPYMTFTGSFNSLRSYLSERDQYAFDALISRAVHNRAGGEHEPSGDLPPAIAGSIEWFFEEESKQQG